MKTGTIIIAAAVVAALAGLGFFLAADRGDVSGVRIGTRVGDQAPEFSIQTIDGQRISLSDFNGKKPLVITTTASWCSTCVIEANNFSPVYAQFRDAVEFLSVSVDPTDDRGKLEAFQVKTQSPWFYTEPNLAGVRDMILDYALTRFEITYVIDETGIIRFKDTSITSSNQLSEVLASLEKS